jgi:hypothetical protein
MLYTVLEFSPRAKEGYHVLGIFYTQTILLCIISYCELRENNYLWRFYYDKRSEMDYKSDCKIERFLS